MHSKYFTKYYFINSLDTNNLEKQDKDTIIIYRNYSFKSIDLQKILKLKNFLKKRGNKFYISNDFKLALKLKLDGVYLPSFYTKFSHLTYSTFSNFDIVGSAHNLKEIRTKEFQKVQKIFISSLFKKNKNYLGLNKFQVLQKYTNKNVVALGGISKKNLKKLKLLNISCFAGISYFNKKKGP